MKPEESLQITIADWLRWNHPSLLWWHTPNGGARNIAEGAKFKRMGVRAGVPDIFIPHPTNKYTGFFCELKSSKGSLTPSQKEVMERLKELNFYVCVSKSLDDFVENLKKYNNDCS